MAVSSVTPTSNSIQPKHGRMQELKQDFGDLGSALQAGNLASAQQAFASLQQLQGQFGQNGGAGQDGGQQGGSFVDVLSFAVASSSDASQTNAAGTAGASSSSSNSLGGGFSALGQILASMQQQVGLLGQGKQGGSFELVSLMVEEGSSANPLSNSSAGGNSADQMLAMLEQQLGLGGQASGTGAPQVAASTGTPDQTIRSDMNALGQALQSGDLSAAQQDFSQLTQALQGAAVHHGHRHHHHGGGDNLAAQQQAAASTYASVSNATNTTNPTGITVSNAGTTDTTGAVTATGATAPTTAASTSTSTTAPVSVAV